MRIQVESGEEGQKCDICINIKLEKMVNIKLDPYKGSQMVI